MRNVKSKIGVALCFLILATRFGFCGAPQDWTAEDKETWKKAVKKVVTTPPCCGACSVLSMSEGRKAYKYVVGEEKTDEGEKVYKEHEKRLLDAFKYFNPSRYQHWFEKNQQEGKKDEK